MLIDTGIIQRICHYEIVYNNLIHTLFDDVAYMTFDTRVR